MGALSEFNRVQISHSHRIEAGAEGPLTGELLLEARVHPGLALVEFQSKSVPDGALRGYAVLVVVVLQVSSAEDEDLVRLEDGSKEAHGACH